MMATSIVKRLMDSVERTPQAEALVYGGQRIHYEELWHDVSRVSTFLREGGIRPGDRVALLMENSPEYAASYYGALACGGTVVALNSSAKARDLLHWLRHSEATFLVVNGNHPALTDILQQTGDRLRILLLSETYPEPGKNITCWHELAAARSSSPVAKLRPRDLAAIIYTSGTTGDPKGVMLSHGNLDSNVASILAYLKLRDSDRVLNILPFYYSYGNSVLHTHLASGACVVLENGLTYPHRIMQAIADEQITGFSGVPSTYTLLLNRVKLEQYDLSSLRYLTQAGGAMAPTHIRRITQAIPHAAFFVMYGQTEATARITYLPPDKLHHKLGSAGVPIPGVEVEVRGKDGVPLLPGKTGEIHVRGDNVMQGYWKNPAATAQVLEKGWLKTGDLARMDEDGYLYIQGRSSDMIKTGAHRINPLDIEEVIGELETVAEVAVVGVPDEILGEVIKAVVVPGQGATLDRKSVLAHCRRQLPMYKLPKHIEFTDHLPKTASGKVKRHLLANTNKITETSS